MYSNHMQWIHNNHPHQLPHQLNGGEQGVTSSAADWVTASRMPSMIPLSQFHIEDIPGIALESHPPVKPRHRLKPTQTEFLTREFNINPNPNAATRTAIATQLKLRDREVQVWFQNRRAKIKREKTQQTQTKLSPLTPSSSSSSITATVKRRSSAHSIVRKRSTTTASSLVNNFMRNSASNSDCGHNKNNTIVANHPGNFNSFQSYSNAPALIAFNQNEVWTSGQDMMIHHLQHQQQHQNHLIGNWTIVTPTMSNHNSMFQNEDISGNTTPLPQSCGLYFPALTNPDMMILNMQQQQLSPPFNSHNSPFM